MTAIPSPRRRGALAAILCAAALSVAGPAWAADPIRIGSSGPLSGSLSLLGQGVRDGMEVYIDYVNEQGGVNGRKIELIVEDDGYDPMRSLASAKKLVEQDKVVALLSPDGTPGVAAMVPYAQEQKVPIIAPYAFSHTLTTPTKRFVFTTLPEVRVQAALLGDYLVTTLKHRKIAAIYQNDDFGQDAVAGLEEKMKGLGVPLTKLPFDRGTTNISGRQIIEFGSSSERASEDDGFGSNSSPDDPFRATEAKGSGSESAAAAWPPSEFNAQFSEADFEADFEAAPIANADATAAVNASAVAQSDASSEDKDKPHTAAGTGAAPAMDDFDAEFPSS